MRKGNDARATLSKVRKSNDVIRLPVKGLRPDIAMSPVRVMEDFKTLGSLYSKTIGKS
jgi:hypothetical protein